MHDPRVRNLKYIYDVAVLRERNTHVRNLFYFIPLAHKLSIKS